MEVTAWIGNLGKYNEGELVGEWVTFPIDEDDWEEVMERIGICDYYEEWFCADYDSELPLYKMFGEYPSYEKLNELAEEVEDIDDEDVFCALTDNYATDVWGAIDQYKSGDWRFYPHCDSMSDVAYQIVQDEPWFNEAPEFMQRHFDFKGYGEELDSCGTFIPCGNGYVEVW